MSEHVTGIELTCEEIHRYLMAYLDAELPARERAIFDAHLAICRDCENYLASYQETIRLAKAAHANPAPPALLPTDLVRAILEARRPPG